MTERKPFPPVFATNHPDRGETVAQEVNRLFGGMRNELKTPPNLAIATAYINPQGFSLIADEVEKAPHVRILLGAEPDEPFRSQRDRGEQVSFEEVAAVHLQGLERMRDLLGFNGEADRSARRLVTWLRSSTSSEVAQVEVRRFTKGFLHGKAFIAEHPTMSAVLAGSSNLTYAGLSLNRELNLGYPSGNYSELVINWFNELWDDSTPFDLAAIYESRWLPHSPNDVFLRMLYELYGEAVTLNSHERLELRVTDFQRDGILRAQRIMNELGGVLVCDEVGLGKTFIAGEFIKAISQKDRQKVLIVVPAALKTSTWLPFLKNQDLISARVELVTYDDIRIGTKPAVQHLDDYAFVVIDEAHNLRNPNTLRAEKVMELLWKDPPKKVLLLTATPVNNSLADLHTLVSYFVRNDAQFAPNGIPSIRDYIKQAQDQDPDTLSPEHLFELMDKVAVRRTRRFIKKEYANDRIFNNLGELVPIVFPTPVVKRLTYKLQGEAEILANRVIHALQVREDESLVIRSGQYRDPTRLSLARYAPSVYGFDSDIDKLQLTNVGLLRSGLLKRLESSTMALSVTLDRLIRSHETFVEGLDAGYVMIGEALKEYASTESDDLDEFLANLSDKAQDQVLDASDFNVAALRTDVVGDITLLNELHAISMHCLLHETDAKLLELITDLENIADDAQQIDSGGVSESDRRKVIIFSTYADTVIDLHDRLSQMIDIAPQNALLADYRGRLAPAVFGSTGSGGQIDRTAVLANFCPMTAGELREDKTPASKDLYDILITTDVLAEGVNLQQAGRMVNFDLPWNPMRLVQRHGRIDRIGSPHKRIFIDCFFPEKNLDKLLGLEATLQRKIAYANAAIGTGTVLPDQISNPDVEVLLHDKRAEIESLYNEDNALLVEGGGNDALSGEEYRRRLAKAFGSSYLRRSVKDLPYGAGSGFVSTRISQSGYVFCARVGESPEPWFRFVAADPNSWEPLRDRAGVPRINNDLLTCLIAADPGSDVLEQFVAGDALTQVFGAWELAQTDIYEKWSWLTDPMNLHPQVEKSQREAIELVSVEGVFLDPAAQEELVAKLGGRWQSGVVRSIREIVRDEGLSPRDKVIKLQEFVSAAGLPIPIQPEPLAPIRVEDVRVVCWMAITPAKHEVALP